MTDTTFERIANFRDAGGHATGDGHRVRTGLLYRCGHLANATDADVEVLEQLGIGVIVDLRRDVERGIEGESRLPPRARVVYLPMGDVRGGPDIREVTESRTERGYPVVLAERILMDGSPPSGCQLQAVVIDPSGRRMAVFTLHSTTGRGWLELAAVLGQLVSSVDFEVSPTDSRMRVATR